MNSPRQLLLPLVAFLACAVSGMAEDTLRYYNTSQQQYLGFPLAGQTLIQRFRTETPVRVLGFTVYLYGNETGDVGTLLLEDAGGSPLPEFIDRQITNGWARPVTFRLPVANQTIPATYRYPADQQLVLKEPGQFFIAVYSQRNVLVLYDTTDVTSRMCNDDDPGTFNTFEVGSFNSIIQGNGRQFGVLQVPGNGGQRLATGSFMIDVHVEPIDTVATKSFADITSAAFGGDLAGNRIAWGDFDNDGDQDLLSSGSLWANDGSGRFSRNTSLSGAEGVGIFADLNNDGWMDILTATQAFRNNGDNTFTAQSATGQVDAPNATTVTAADYDGDGLMDFFVGTWEKPMKAANPGSDSVDVLGIGYKDHLYRNLGGFRFEEVTDAALQGYRETPRGYNPATQANDIPGYPVLYSSNWVDYDSDGDLDLFWGVYRLAANYLWRNNGDGTFTDVAEETALQGHAKPLVPNTFGHVIGSDWDDYDNDGDADLALGQLAHPRLYPISDRTAIYRNKGNGAFEDVNNRDTIPALAGIAYNESHSDVAWGDYDNDGQLDLYINAIYECYYSSLYRQRTDGTFEPRTYQTGTRTQEVHGLAWVDIDNDGDLDLHVGGDGENVRLFRNETAAAGNNWAAIGLRLAEGGNRFGIGSKITAFSGGKRYTRTITAGFGSQSQKPALAYFGLGSGAIDSVQVMLPKGVDGEAKVLTYRDIPAGRYTILTSLSPASSVPVQPLVAAHALAAAPNPAHMFTKLTLQDAPSFGDAVTIEVIDLLGETVRTVDGAIFLNGACTLDLAGLPAGGYVVRVVGAGRMATVPVMVVR